MEEREGGIADVPLPLTARSLLRVEVEVEVTGGETVREVPGVVRRHTKVIKSKKAEKTIKFPGAKDTRSFCSETSADPPIV